MTLSDRNASPLMGFTAEIVAAYVSNNPMPTSEIADLINSVRRAMEGLGKPVMEEAVLKLVPAVPVRKSVTDDYVVCLEDGKQFKSLKRHLMTHYQMTPEEYRTKWNLPADYPMVAPNYAAARSRLAKTMGLGRKPGSASAPAKVPSRRLRKRSDAMA